MSLISLLHFCRLTASKLKLALKMHFWLIYPIISRCAAASLFKQDSSRTSLKTLQPDSVDQSHFLPDQARFTPSSKDDVHLIRVREIQQNRQGYLYDPSLLGITSYFPTGLLGDAMVKPHIVSWLRDAAWVDHAAVEEASAAAAAAKEVSSTTFLNTALVLTQCRGLAPECQTIRLCTVIIGRRRIPPV